MKSFDLIADAKSIKAYLEIIELFREISKKDGATLKTALTEVDKIFVQVMDVLAKEEPKLVEEITGASIETLKTTH